MPTFPDAPDARIYRWADLPVDHPMPALERRRIMGDRMMLSEILLHAGCRVPTHQHENEQFACVIRGTMRFGIGAEGSANRREVTVTAGGVFHVPSNVPHSAEALEESLLLDVFAPPSATTGVDDAHVTGA